MAAVSVGWDNAIALKKDGTVWSWGVDTQDGGGTITPVKIEGLTDIISVSNNQTVASATTDSTDKTVELAGRKESNDRNRKTRLIVAGSLTLVLIVAAAATVQIVLTK